MEIVKVETAAEMTEMNVYYEFEGAFYSRCWNCGKPVKVDSRRTAADLRREDAGEEQYFCNEACERDWFLSNFNTLDEAMIAGEEARAYKFFEFNVEKTYVCRYYDDDSAENSASSPEGKQTIVQLKNIAKEYAKNIAFDDPYFRAMTMSNSPDVTVEEEHVDISFDFREGDFTTSIEVTFWVTK